MIASIVLLPFLSLAPVVAAWFKIRQKELSRVPGAGFDSRLEEERGERDQEEHENRREKIGKPSPSLLD